MTNGIDGIVFRATASVEWKKIEPICCEISHDRVILLSHYPNFAILLRPFSLEFIYTQKGL
jgi:hypothetical protein